SEIISPQKQRIEGPESIVVAIAIPACDVGAEAQPRSTRERLHPIAGVGRDCPRTDVGVREASGLDHSFEVVVEWTRRSPEPGPPGMPDLAAVPLVERRLVATVSDVVEIDPFCMVLRARADRVGPPQRAARLWRIIEHARVRAHIAGPEPVHAPASPLHHDRSAVERL